MSGFYSPKLIIANGWQTTLHAAFQTLRRIKFVVDNTFSFGDFDPQFNFNGMGTAALIVYRARFLKILNLLWVSIDFTVTLSAPLAANIGIIIPATAAGSSVVGASQAFYSYIGGVPGNSVIAGGTNILNIQNSGLGNFAATATRILANGFIEVL